VAQLISDRGGTSLAVEEGQHRAAGGVEEVDPILGRIIDDSFSIQLVTKQSLSRFRIRGHGASRRKSDIDARQSIDFSRGRY
jgi:hypothetical protein